MWANSYMHMNLCLYFSSYWWTNQLLCKYAYVDIYIYRCIPVAPTFLSARMSCKHFHFHFFKLNTIFFYFLLWYFLCFIDALSYSRAHKRTHVLVNFTNVWMWLASYLFTRSAFLNAHTYACCLLIWRRSPWRLTIKQKFPNV